MQQQEINKLDIDDPNFSLKGVHAVPMKEPKVLPYSFWRIKRILLKDYHIRLENIPTGYKENRRPGFRQLYRLINEDTGEVEIEKASLNGLREVLTQEKYPLHDSGWNEKAEYFMELVQELREQAKK